jgi:hypothetical protein
MTDIRKQHFFLQHLPSIPHLRSLYIPFLADHVHGTNVDPRELALQIVDIVTLRPEVQLCYMGIANKCFEILETRRNDTADSWLDQHLDGVSGTHQHGVVEDAAGSEEEDNEEGEGEDEDDDEEELDEEDDTESEEDDDAYDDSDDSESGAEGAGGESARNGLVSKLRLREILFYDDKVAVFKARHGRL